VFGFLNIDKPQGLTSRDVVNRVQRMLRGERIGHAGTLDPLATGVLVVGLGPATRLVQYVQRMPKRYVGTFLLGRASDTEDIEGTITELDNPSHPSREQLQAALPRFTGRIEQRPPAYSALKIAGARAYELARAGRAVDLAPRETVVYGLELLRYEYPELELAITCGSGTYVRSLGRDLAEAVGTAAVMSALRRTAIGSFLVAQACALDDLSPQAIPARLLPARLALADLPAIRVLPEEQRRLANGIAIPNRWSVQAVEIAVLDEAERLIAIASADRQGAVRPFRNFQRA
jgi:tRNA pseudouridine55 synthase